MMREISISNFNQLLCLHHLCVDSFNATIWFWVVWSLQAPKATGTDTIVAKNIDENIKKKISRKDIKHFRFQLNQNIEMKCWYLIISVIHHHRQHFTIIFYVVYFLLIFSNRFIQRKTDLEFIYIWVEKWIANNSYFVVYLSVIFIKCNNFIELYTHNKRAQHSVCNKQLLLVNKIWYDQID